MILLSISFNNKSLEHITNFPKLWPFLENMMLDFGQPLKNLKLHFWPLHFFSPSLLWNSNLNVVLFVSKSFLLLSNLIFISLEFQLKRGHVQIYVFITFQFYFYFSGFPIEMWSCPNLLAFTRCHSTKCNPNQIMHLTIPL